MTSGGLTEPRSLLGTWVLDRVVDDRRVGDTSHVHGRLVLTSTRPDIVSWQESGTWHRSAGDVEVARNLQLVLTDDGWWVRFEDGADFHPWSPGESVVHECAPDTYRGQVSGTPERWTVVWEVTGPWKDYTMTTVLSPVAGVSSS